MHSKAIGRLLDPVRRFSAALWNEGLAPDRAAAAVFVGIFIGNVPIYGFQTLAALGLAVMFGLNKPLTFAATFINNPLFQPFLIIAAAEIGHLLLTGHWQKMLLPEMSARGLREGFSAWALGSVVVGAILGGVGALCTFLIVSVKNKGASARLERARFVNNLFAPKSRFDRGFVRWKLRLDRIFDILAAEDLGSGPAVDLGCGYGIALAFAACDSRDRRLVGCDLDAARIAAGQRALASLNADLSVADVRDFELPPADLILILDVLQYLSAEEQVALLARCCAALQPGGKFIFRVHDRERGILSRLSLAFDRLIFFVGRAANRPLMLPAGEYRNALQCAGMHIEEHRLRNRLPLAHLVFVARKPPIEEARP